jgi:hypothetical protein
MTRWLTTLWSRLAAAELPRRGLLGVALGLGVGVLARRRRPPASAPPVDPGIRPARLDAPLVESVLPSGPLGPGDDLAG